MYILKTKEDDSMEFKVILSNGEFTFDIKEKYINLYIKESLDNDTIINIIKALNRHFKYPIIIYTMEYINKDILLDFNWLDVIYVKKRVLR